MYISCLSCFFINSPSPLVIIQMKILSPFSGHLIKLYTSLHLSPHERFLKSEWDVIFFCNFAETALYEYHSQKMNSPMTFLQILIFKTSFNFALTERPYKQSRSQWVALRLPCGSVPCFLWHFSKQLHYPGDKICGFWLIVLETVTNKFWNPFIFLFDMSKAR